MKYNYNRQRKFRFWNQAGYPDIWNSLLNKREVLTNWLDIRYSDRHILCLFMSTVLQNKNKPESVWKAWSAKDVSYGKNDTITLNLQIS